MKHLVNIYYFNKDQLLDYYNKLAKSEQRELVLALVSHSMFNHLEIISEN